MGKRIVCSGVLVVLLMVLAAVPAFAEGYNKGPAPIAPGTGWGPLTGDERLSYPPIADAQPGPHGGYTTTTNRCQDCHSTHYASGKYKLLRADSRESACDFCHTGGGGSNMNIMMDNDYTNSAAEVSSTGTAAVDATTTMGFGTGHTLGYKGNAPTDIRPAYSNPEGFACFDCHTPHGNSARVLTTFFSPGTLVSPAYLDYTVHVRFDPYCNLTSDPWTPIETVVQLNDPEEKLEDISLIPNGWVNDGLVMDQGPEIIGSVDDGPKYGWYMAWGIASSAEGNIEVKYNFTNLSLGPDVLSYVPIVSRKPIFPTGRYLLLKNPDNENGLGLAGDLSTQTVTVGGKQVHTSVDTSHTSNKLAIDWENPLGLAMTARGHADSPVEEGETPVELLYGGNDERYPFPWFITGDTGDMRPGIASVGEFCTDCHDGTAGLSTQAAEVWKPNASNSTTGAYQIAYSHDSQPRTCDRKMIINSDDTNNFGPDCRSCHVGASSCAQCHADPSLYGADEFQPLDEVWNTEGRTPREDGYDTYRAQPSYKAVSRKIYREIGQACVDGGFSFPHRTLGANMLKDNLWGVDFDGTPLAPGEIRGEGLSAGSLDMLFGSEARSFDVEALANKQAESLDSACLDCHNPAIWNADDPSYEISITADNVLGAYGYRTEGAADGWTIQGWDVLLKGLP